MLIFLEGFKSLVHFKQCLIDNATFRLHYKFTFGLLCLASFLQTAKQYFGDPIDCKVDNKWKDDKDIINTFCWINGTYTLSGQNSLYPGVGANKTEERIYHSWYQWVPFVLFFQALLCYTPHFLWKMWEGGKLKLLLQNFSEKTLDVAPQATKARRHIIVGYFMRNRGTHNLYMFQFVFCEFLNLLNLIGQMYLMDAFFGGQFSAYGSEVISMTGGTKDAHPMDKVFPKIAKCSFYSVGYSGTTQHADALCILPLNTLNEKIFLGLWFWYFILLIWTGIYLCCRVVTIASAYSRHLIFCGRAKSNCREDVATIMKNLWFGDWFILMQLCKHMDPMVFHDLVVDLAVQMEPKKRPQITLL